MKVKDRMTPKPYTTTPDTYLVELWRFMQEKNLQRMPIMDRGQLVGIITRRDFNAKPDLNLRRTAVEERYLQGGYEQSLSKLRVRDIKPLDQQLVTIHQEAYIEQAAKLLSDNRISGLPVIDDEGKLVGIITQNDLSTAFLYILGVNCQGTRLCLRVDRDAQYLLPVMEILSRYNAKIDTLVRMEVKDEQALLIIRLDTVDSRAIVEEIREAGYRVESVIVKR